MSWPVVIGVLVGIVGLTTFVVARAPRARVGHVMVLAMLVAVVVFSPWRCDGAIRVPWVTPPKPATCQTVYGAGLPRLGFMAPDTVGYSLGVVGLCLCMAATYRVAVRRFGRPE